MLRLSLTLMLTATLLPPAPASGSPATEPCARLAPAPPTGTGWAYSTLSAMTFVPGATWAVGGYDQPGSRRRTLAARRDATAWSISQTPNLAGYENELLAVHGTSAHDVWAVGRATGKDDLPLRNRSLVEHYDGRVWTIVPGPAPLAQSRVDELRGVVALSASDAWAVGAREQLDQPPRAVIVRWNGRRWTSVPAPGNGAGMRLNAVAASSGTDVWAVGALVGDGPWDHPLVLRWNGSRWRSIPTPAMPDGGGVITGVVARSPTDVWVVGQMGFGSNPLALHWTGASWRMDPIARDGFEFTGIARGTNGDLWAAGYSFRELGEDPMSLIAHRSGGAWTFWTDIVGALGLISAMEGVAVSPAGEVWAVGHEIGIDEKPTNLMVLRLADCPAAPQM